MYKPKNDGRLDLDGYKSSQRLSVSRTPALANFSRLHTKTIGDKSAICQILHCTRSEKG